MVDVGEIIFPALEYLMWVVYLFATTRMLHIVQLEGYHTKDYFNWITKNWKVAMSGYFKQFLIIFAVFAFSLLLNLIALRWFIAYIDILKNIGTLITVFSFFAVTIFYIVKDIKSVKHAKKPFAFTARVKRLVLYNFVVLVFFYAIFIPYLGREYIVSYPYEYVDEAGVAQTVMREFSDYALDSNSYGMFYGLAILLIPFNMLIANWLVSPTERFIANIYIGKARRLLKKKAYKNLIRIGVTGSYGKTSTKFILNTILSEKYNVFATPESYNTSMGNVRAIREQLKPEHEVFISEMGARNKFDIQEICGFVRPQYAIITSIGPQHLETFKKIENVAKAKAEILYSTNQKVTAFLPVDNQYCESIYNNYENEKFSYSLRDQKADVYAKDISLDAYGSSFTVVTHEGEFRCTTKLLGEHNISNILGCISIALRLGLTNEQIRSGVSKVEAIPHRLQILPSDNGTIVIDDAFNSNPVGSKAALEVLSKFPGRKIIITPGMVELGKDEYSYNWEFGKSMAQVVSVAILVGVERSVPMVQGLKDASFDEMNIYVVSDLKEATSRLAKISKSGDVILFENDLPDNYVG